MAGTENLFVPEWDYGVVDVADNSTTVYAKPALLKAIYINTVLSAHDLIIKDGTTTVYTIPGGACASNKYDFENTKFLTSLVIDPDDAATGNITCIYRPLLTS